MPAVELTKTTIPQWRQLESDDPMVVKVDAPSREAGAFRRSLRSTAL